MNKTTALALTDTDALIAELFSRFDHAVFIAQTSHSTQCDQEIFRVNGNRRTCQGLCIGAVTMIDRYHQDNARVVSDEEDDR